MRENDMSEQENSNAGAGGLDAALFTQLVLSFQAAAWQQMGKVKSIVTGKLERNLEMAKHSINMLGMLKEKTSGNLTEDESKYLDHVLYELRMNYLDEIKKGPDTREEGEGEKEEKAPEDSPSDATGENAE
jgi:hypothetical protein